MSGERIEAAIWIERRFEYMSVSMNKFAINWM